MVSNVAITVRDRETNRPIEDVIVMTPLPLGKTDANGFFEIEGWTKSKIFLLLVRGDYLPFQKTYDVPPFMTLSIEAEMTKRPTVGRGDLAGTVTDHDTDEAIRGARVNLIKDGVTISSDSTDSNGAYDIREIEAGRYKVSASKPGYETETRSVTIVEATTNALNLELRPEAPPPPPPPPPGTINLRFIVREKRTNRSIRGALVEILDNGRRIASGRTPERGMLELGGVPIGTFTARVSYSGFETYEKPIDTSRKEHFIKLYVVGQAPPPVKEDTVAQYQHSSDKKVADWIVNKGYAKHTVTGQGDLNTFLTYERVYVCGGQEVNTIYDQLIPHGFPKITPENPKPEVPGGKITYQGTEFVPCAGLSLGDTVVVTAKNLHSLGVITHVGNPRAAVNYFTGLFDIAVAALIAQGKVDTALDDWAWAVTLPLSDKELLDALSIAAVAIDIATLITAIYKNWARITKLAGTDIPTFFKQIWVSKTGSAMPTRIADIISNWSKALRPGETIDTLVREYDDVLKNFPDMVKGLTVDEARGLANNLDAAFLARGNIIADDMGIPRSVWDKIMTPIVEFGGKLQTVTKNIDEGVNVEDNILAYFNTVDTELTNIYSLAGLTARDPASPLALSIRAMGQSKIQSLLDSQGLEKVADVIGRLHPDRWVRNIFRTLNERKKWAAVTLPAWAIVGITMTGFTDFIHEEAVQAAALAADSYIDVLTYNEAERTPSNIADAQGYIDYLAGLLNKANEHRAWYRGAELISGPAFDSVFESYSKQADSMQFRLEAIKRAGPPPPPKPELQTITLDILPTNADVLIDGVPQERYTQQVFDVKVTLGPHTLRVQRDETHYPFEMPFAVVLSFASLIPPIELKEKLAPEETGKIYVESSPSNFEIVLDGDGQGRYTNGWIYDVPLGTHLITVKRDGWKTPDAKEVELTATVPERRVDMGTIEKVEPEAVHYIFNTTPKRITITIPGYGTFKSDGTGVFEIDLTPATYYIRFEKDGYRTQRQYYDVRKAEPKTVSIVLEKKEEEEEEEWEPYVPPAEEPGTLMITTAPAEMTIDIPGVGGFTSSAQGSFQRELTAGSYEILFSKAGFSFETKTAIIKAGQVCVLTVILEETLAPPIPPEPEAPNAWRYDISSIPQHAKIMVDDAFVDKWTPDYVDLFPNSTYKIGVVKSGYYPASVVITTPPLP